MKEKILLQGIVNAINDGHNFKMALLADEEGNFLQLSNRELGLISEALKHYKRYCNEQAKHIDGLKKPWPGKSESFRQRGTDADALADSMGKTFNIYELD